MISDAEHGANYEGYWTNPTWARIETVCQALHTAHKRACGLLKLTGFVVYYSRDLYNPNTAPYSMLELPVRNEIDPMLKYNTLRVAGVVE